MNEKFSKLLEEHHLKKTGPRLSVLEILSQREAATSQPDLEDILGKQVDRVTLYRILKTFEEKGIIHRIIDVNGTANYAVCSSSCSAHAHHDEHLHFNCTRCHQVYCMDDLHIPPINMPAGFKTESLNLIASGICSYCSKE